MTAAFADDCMQKNAAFRSKAGFMTCIERRDHPGCCERYSRQAGRYEYPAVPKDVYRRHDNCKCTVTYRTDGKPQDVWSKRMLSEEEEQELPRRKELPAE